MVSVTATTTPYRIWSTRRVLTDDRRFSAMLKKVLERAFLDEDKPMLEKQQQRMGTPDLWSLQPILLAIDAGAVRAPCKLEALNAADPA